MIQATRLTDGQINALTKGNGVKKIAVENFLMSTDPRFDLSLHVANLNMDAAQYRWNAQTKLAIRKGLKLIYGR